MLLIELNENEWKQYNLESTNLTKEIVEEIIKGVSKGNAFIIIEDDRGLNVIFNFILKNVKIGGTSV